MKTLPKISIIIPTYYAGSLLEKCLNSIKKASYPNIETIIVDNSPPNISLVAIKKKFASKSFKFIKTPRKFYFANGVNLGFSKASGQYIFIANDDIQFQTESLRLLAKKLQSSPQIAAVHPKVVALPSKKIDSLGGVMNYLGFCFKKTSFQDRRKLFYLTIGLFRKNVLDQTSVYDPDFIMFWEDVDLSWRLWLAGYKIVLEPQAVILHHVSSTAKRIPSEFTLFHVRKNRLSTLIKNYSLAYLCFFLPLLVLAYLCLGLIQSLQQKNLSSSKASLKAILWNLAHLPQTLKKRAQVQKQIRQIPDREILKRLSGFF
jgi:GT2 family glycosyltransferase